MQPPIPKVTVTGWAEQQLHERMLLRANQGLQNPELANPRIKARYVTWRHQVYLGNLKRAGLADNPTFAAPASA